MTNRRCEIVGEDIFGVSVIKVIKPVKKKKKKKQRTTRYHNAPSNKYYAPGGSCYNNRRYHHYHQLHTKLTNKEGKKLSKGQRKKYEKQMHHHHHRPTHQQRNRSRDRYHDRPRSRDRDRYHADNNTTKRPSRIQSFDKTVFEPNGLNQGELNSAGDIHNTHKVVKDKLRHRVKEKQSDEEVVIVKELKIEKDIELAETMQNDRTMPALENDSDHITQDEVMIVRENYVPNTVMVVDLRDEDPEYVTKFCPVCSVQYRRHVNDIKNKCSLMTCTNPIHKTEFVFWCWKCGKQVAQEMVSIHGSNEYSAPIRACNCKRRSTNMCK
eukprot:897302_1